jgi:putative DNA primase/helicase
MARRKKAPTSFTEPNRGNRNGSVEDNTIQTSLYKKNNPETTSSNPCLENALAYAELGWQVFPCHSIISDSCSCGDADCKSPGKHPRTPNGLKDASTDPEIIKGWWSRWADANIAVVTGHASGMSVLDIDVKGGGPGNLELLESEHEPLPKTLVAQTGGGGRHYFFKYPVDGFKNSAGNIISGVDTRGDGGYVIVHPSNHISGGIYSWEDNEPGEIELSEIPVWIISLMRKDRGKGVSNFLKKNDQVVEGGRNNFLIQQGGILRADGLETKDVIEALLEINQKYCSPPLSEHEVRQMEKSVAKWEKGVSTASYGRNTDAGNASRFEKKFYDKLIYVDGRGWFCWTGKHWLPSSMVTEQATKVAKDIYIEARNAFSTKEQGYLCRWATRSLTLARLDAMIKLARPKLEVPVAVLDSDSLILNVSNGIIDLKTGKLLIHDPKKYQTKIIEVDFDPKASCPRWLQFVNEITCDDQELAEYLQRVTGYCLTGLTMEQCFFIFLGDGLNGKSTFLDTLKAILGDYSDKCESETFLEKKYSNSINCDIAKLSGVRMAIASEIAKDKNLNEPLIKTITGDDEITARFMRQNYFTFTPQFKVLWACNEEPSIQGSDYGIWRRIRIIKFNYRVSKVDKFLMKTLLTESAGILKWAVDGCLAWQKEGLNEPDSVRNATLDYQHKNDGFHQFFSQCVEKCEDSNVTCESFYNGYLTWFEGTGQIRLMNSKIEVGKKMSRRGYFSKSKRIDGPPAKVYEGLRLTGKAVNATDSCNL